MPLAFWRQLGKSFSCYYSGNFETGFKHGYVQKIYASIRQSVASSGAEPIAVVPTRQVQLKPANPLRQAAAELADAIVARRIQEFSGASHTAASPPGPMLSQPAPAYSLPSRVAPVAPAAAPEENELYVVKATGQGRGVAVPAPGPQALTPTDQSVPASMQRAPQTVPQVDSAFVFRMEIAKDMAAGPPLFPRS